MKTIFLLTTVVVFFNNCNSSSSRQDVEESLVGTYTYYGKDEISEANDTLRISIFNTVAKTYKIVKSTGFNRFVDGKRLPTEFKTQEMLMVYDAASMQLRDIKTGRVFSFTPGKKELLYGSATYVKIK